MVLPGFFSKSSPKKKPTSDSKDRSKITDFSLPSPISRSSSKSPTKVVKDREPRASRKIPDRRGSPRRLDTTDTHPLNLPPDERERRRSAMEASSEASASIDVDQDDSAPSVPSSPLPMASAVFQDLNGDAHPDRINGDSSPVPPPHGKGLSPSPPPRPSIDAEECKTTGNRYFVNREYGKAIAEYTKGRHSLGLFSCRSI